MTNYEFWPVEKAEEMYRKYIRERVSDPLKPTIAQWLYKEADTALQVNPGDVIQMTDGYRDSSGNLRTRFVYVKVNALEECECGCAICGVAYRTLGEISYRKVGSDYVYKNKIGKLLPADAIADRLKDGNLFKVADVPSELISLVSQKCPNIERCPLKDEGACMKGGDNE